MIPGLGKSPGEGTGNPLQYSCLENPMDGESHGWSSLAGYSPQGGKELHTTRLSHTFTYFILVSTSFQPALHLRDSSMFIYPYVLVAHSSSLVE